MWTAVVEGPYRSKLRVERRGFYPSNPRWVAAGHPPAIGRFHSPSGHRLTVAMLSESVGRMVKLILSPFVAVNGPTRARPRPSSGIATM